MSSQSDEMAVYGAIYCTECGGRTMIVVTPGFVSSHCPHCGLDVAFARDC